MCRPRYGRGGERAFAPRSEPDRRCVERETQPKHRRRMRETRVSQDAPVPTATPTLCPYCGTGCGLSVEVRDGRVARVTGDPRHPVNRGRTCRKPTELGSAVHAPDRPTAPLL